MRTDIVQKALVFNKSTEILLLRRSDTDTRRPLQWDLPGGLLDEGETLEQGVMREIIEETSLSVKNPKLVFSKTELSEWLDEVGSHKANTIRLYYLCIAENEDVVLSYEHSEFSWLKLSDAVQIIEYPKHKEVLQFVFDNKLAL